MSIEPRTPTQNVNVSARHPLSELAWLLAGATAVVAAIYVLMGLLVNVAVDSLSPETERRIATEIGTGLAGIGSGERDEHLTQMLAALLEKAPDLKRSRDFSISVSVDPQTNAFALPNGHIIVLKGLLDAVESENELAMVLGHELGHYAQRDHLRRMGRGLILGVAATLMFGVDSNAAQWIFGAVNIAEARFSRSQESAADEFGLRLLNMHYGHVGGFSAFFTRLAEDQGMPLSWTRSHPNSLQRVEDLNQQVRALAFETGPLTPSPYSKRSVSKAAESG